MQITWVNHASFVANIDGVRLISDPWIEGSAFDNGWSLLSKSKFGFHDFRDIQYVFFSHEHPDHFSPPNLRCIPEEYRRNITVLFHETKDKRVVKFCKGSQFRTMELPTNVWVQLTDDAAVLCGRQGLIDSWLAVREKGQTLLNLNDCVFDDDAELERIYELVGAPDVLLTQFSYANWVGNPGDWLSHREHARKKLNDMKRQVRFLRPKAIIPCASFVWFSHAENFFANREANRIGDVFKYLTQNVGITTVVLYPGDVWEVGAEIDCTVALARYAIDYTAIETAPLTTADTVPLEKLRNAHQAYRRKISAKNSRLLLSAIPSCTVHITDLRLTVQVSILGGLQLSKNQSDVADICLSSEALQYCYLFDWGGDTVAVNGRYTVPPGGNPRKFFWNFRVPTYNSTGQEFDVGLMAAIGGRYMRQMLHRKFNSLRKQ